MQKGQKKREAIKLLKRFVESKLAPGKYKDCEIKGFGLRVYPSGHKTYIVETRIKDGKVCTYTIGDHGPWTAETAREEALRVKKLLKDGENPNEHRKEQSLLREAEKREQQRIKDITLHAVLNDYLQTKRLKENTAYNYRLLINSNLKDWLEKSITDISKDMVEARHQLISQSKPGEADNVMRVLRALLTFASYKYENNKGEPLIVINPVRRLSQQKLWNKLPRRQTAIKAHELKPWTQAVLTLESHVFRDYFLLLLLTGLRKGEAESLRWENVDFNADTLLIQETKNHEPLMLPMTDYLHGLMLERWQERENDVWVFPGGGEAGHITDPQIQLEKVEKASGVNFTLHDLRRTFIIIADGLGIGHYTVKKLVNHKNSADVTAGYFAAEVERLREPMEKINQFILNEAGIKTKPRKKKKAGNVVQMPARVAN